MKIAYQIKAKNGVLWQAAEKVGGVSALARHLGLRYEYLISLINMRVYPGFKSDRTTLDWAAIEKKLLDLTGLLLEDIFPTQLATSEFMERPLVRVLTQNIEVEQLTAAHERLQLPASVDNQQFVAERANALEKVLSSLEPREQDVLKMRFGLDGREHTTAEVADHYGLSLVRINQIEAKALRKLRHPSRANHLRPFTLNA